MQMLLFTQSDVSCHGGQSILEVVAALRLGTAETEAFAYPWFRMNSNGRFMQWLETVTDDLSVSTVKKLCPW